MFQQSDRNLNISSKTRKEIANEYGFSPRTLARKLKNLNIKPPNGLLTPREILKIYQSLGVPR